MPTTINVQNALQIREKPMEVYIGLQVGSTATITTYTASGQIKSNDSTLSNSSWAMRTLADLAGDGFLLDGSAEWYDSTVTPSENNGKLGVRGDIGETITVTITAGSTLTAVTVASSGVSTITKGADTYTATGNDVITINASSATLVFTPIDSDTRVEIDYIVPGIIFNITNDTLISCTLALRGNLDVKDHTWEESEIEVKMYYPNDISSSLAYIQNDWPITYQAGYDSDLSTERKFYISEPITQEQGVITIKGVDASHLLDSKTMQEQWLTAYTGNAHQTVYTKFINAIQAAGITLQRKQSWSGSQSGTRRYAVLPEMSTRDFVSSVMNLTLNHTRSGTYYGIQFVDAGIPTVEHGNGKTYGQVWTINKSDCGEWSEKYDQNISAIIDSDDERLFAETIKLAPIISPGGSAVKKTLYGMPNGKIITSAPGQPAKYETVKAGQIIDLSYDSFFYDVTFEEISVITSTPSGFVGKAKKNSNITGSGTHWEIQGEAYAAGTPTSFESGTKTYTNSNNLPGINIKMEPFIYGSFLDSNGEAVFNYPSLFKRSLRTGSFTWKGDPRMQPLDYLNIVDDTVTPNVTTTARISSIELTHEEGGTSAKITWREWS